MDIAATVNPGDGALPIADRAVARERARAELRVRPARARQAAAQVRRPRRHADPHDAGSGPHARGRRQGASAQLQQRAGLADRRRDRHRACAPTHISFPELPGNLYSRPTLIWTLDNTGGAQHRVEASYLATQLAWNADYVLTVAPRRQGRRHRRLGHAQERQRHVVQERVAAARRRRSQPRAPGDRPHDGRRQDVREAAAPRRWRRSRSPTTTSTRSAERRRSTTPRPSR